MDTSSRENPLISTQKSSDSSLQVNLHPLVLLTISDYITRHTLRNQQGPIVGALLGQQNGREITLEHAFECHLIQSEEGYILNPEWFEQRLDQMRLVHKDHQLDLVGWYTLLPQSGPTEQILPIHHQILSAYNESAVLLAFHPDQVSDLSSGGKLPVTVYESNHEVDEAKATQPEGEDKEMKDGEPALRLRFRELPYNVETGEAEMISIDFVARGAANASASSAAPSSEPQKKAVAVEADAKGKRRIVAHEDNESDVAAAAPAEPALSRGDEELIAALMAKANAIKMLHSRIQLITKYLESLPPAYVAGEQSAADAAEEARSTGQHAAPSHPILRSVQALVARLPLIVPSSADAFEREMLSEANDVHLVGLISSLMQSVNDVREIGKKFSVVESGRNQRSRMTEYAALGSQSYSLTGAGDLLG